MMSRLCVVIAAASLSGGCALTPYESDFSCPEGFRGKCISVRGAYGESREGIDGVVSGPAPSHEGCSAPGCVSRRPVDPGGDGKEVADSYRASLYTKIGRLLEEPETPVVAPPKVMRVLFLPYRGQDGELYMMRHVYIFVDQPHWVLAGASETPEDQDRRE